MSTRRTFLKMNLAVVGASVLNPIGIAHSEVNARAVDLFVFDGSIPETNLIARRASGLRSLPTGTDLYPLWRDTLRDELVAFPKVVAGVTSGEAAFCLAEVVKDYGYALVQSRKFEPRTGFDPTIVRADALTPTELNRPVAVEWVMEKTGVAFHAKSGMV